MFEIDDDAREKTRTPKVHCRFKQNYADTCVVIATYSWRAFSALRKEIGANIVSRLAIEAGVSRLTATTVYGSDLCQHDDKNSPSKTYL